MLAHCRAALVSLALLTIVTGLAYPAIVTSIAQVAFPYRANGSLVVKDGKTLGSELIGQPFDDPKYFWARPSATTPFAYNAGSSSGSNLSPTNADLVKAVQRSEEHTSELQSPCNLVCRLLLEKKKKHTTRR